MSQPLVSVIMCVRDGEKYIREALDSIARQGVGDLEVVVVDDGSTDNSARIAAAHAILARVISQGRLGLGHAFNTGLQAARGRFITFLDCDDVWPGGRLDAAFAALAQDPEIDFVFGNVVNTDEDLNAIASPLPARLPGSMVIRRESAARVGSMRTDILNSVFVDWCARAAVLGLRSLVLDETVLLRRIHGSNLGIRDRPQGKVDLLRVVRDHLNRKRQ